MLCHLKREVAPPAGSGLRPGAAHKKHLKAFQLITRSLKTWHPESLPLFMPVYICLYVLNAAQDYFILLPSTSRLLPLFPHSVELNLLHLQRLRPSSTINRTHPQAPQVH